MTVRLCKMEQETPEVPSSVEHVAARKDKGKKRRKPVSSSDSDNSSSSSSSFSESDDRRKRYRRRKRIKERKFDLLFNEIKDLKSQLAATQEFHEYDCEPRHDLIDPNVSGDLYEGHVEESEPANIDSAFEVDLNIFTGTKTKEPAVPQASPELTQQLKDLQRFNSQDWINVRYADVQKHYLFAPGFTNLEANDEIKRYDTSKTTLNMEKAFAGISYALLKQRDALLSELQAFLAWAHQVENLRFDDIHTKLKEMLANGEYSKISNDALQLVCGHRAELIQYRREGILSSVKDQYHKNTLRKIAPSGSHLFEADKFNALLEKAGGVKNVFWVEGKSRYNTAPQYEPSTSTRSQTQKQAATYNNRAQYHNQSQYHTSARGRINNNSFRGRGARGSRGRGLPDRSGRDYQPRRSPSSHRDRRHQTHKRKY